MVDNAGVGLVFSLNLEDVVRFLIFGGYNWHLGITLSVVVPSQLRHHQDDMSC